MPGPAGVFITYISVKATEEEKLRELLFLLSYFVFPEPFLNYLCKSLHFVVGWPLRTLATVKASSEDVLILYTCVCCETA